MQILGINPDLNHSLTFLDILNSYILSGQWPAKTKWMLTKNAFNSNSHPIEGCGRKEAEWKMPSTLPTHPIDLVLQPKKSKDNSALKKAKQFMSQAQ